MDTIPVFRAAHLLPHIHYLRKLGAPVDRKLHQARLPSNIEENPNAYMPLIPALKFLTDISSSEGIEDFALRASEQMENGDLDQTLVDDLIYAPSLLIALQSLCDNVSIEDTSVSFWLTPVQNDIRVYSSLNIPTDMHGLRFSEWQQNMVAIDIVRAFAGPTWQPQEMAFRSNLPITRYDAERFPNTRLLSEQRAAWITLPRAMLSLQPIRQHKLGDPTTTSKAASEHNLDFPSSLKAVLLAYFKDGYPDIQLAANISDISVRSLQRRLKVFDLSYSELVHHAQFERAVELLKDPQVRTIDIAYSVGYRDPSNFARAFRRIAGVSPKEYRMQHI